MSSQRHIFYLESKQSWTAEVLSQRVFISYKLYRRLDSSGLLEVHADGGLGDLQVGQTAKVLWETVKGQK